jgi:ADP-heptose:LPS heptosyltransferase
MRLLIEKRHQYCGKLKLQQKLQLISNLDVMLSMDSGTHIAAMLGEKSSRFGK